MSQPTVLVGIADSDARARVVGQLERAGFDVVEVHDGGRVLDLTRRAPPDVVILARDLVRPDALDVCRRLSTDLATKTIPVVVLGRGVDGEFAEAYDAGAVASLPMSIGEKDLVSHMRRQAARGADHAGMADGESERALLLDLAREMTSGRDPRAALHAATRRVAEATGALRAGALLLSAGGTRAFVLARWPLAPAGTRDRIGLAAHPSLAEASAQARWTTADDPQDDPLWPKNDGGALLTFPILHRGDALGLLVMRFPEKVIPDARSVRLAELVALFAAAQLVTAREISRGVSRVRARSAAVAPHGILESRRFLERLIDASRDAVIASDMKGTVLVFNDAAERVTGWRAQELIGKVSVSELYATGMAREIMRNLRSPEKGGVGFAAGMETEIKSRDGSMVPILLSAAVIYDDEGREIATTGFFTDLREQRAMERRLKEAQAALIQTEKQAAVAELAGSAAHELNQPLTAVMGYAELLLKKLAPDDPHVKIVKTIYEEAERMAAVVKKIGRITRYESKVYVGGARIVDLDKSSGSGGPTR